MESVIFLCPAADVYSVNRSVSEVLGDPEVGRNLSRELSKDGFYSTHFAGSAFLSPEEIAKCRSIVGLRCFVADEGDHPHDSWLAMLRSEGLKTVEIGDDGSRLVIDPPPLRSDPEVAVGIPGMDGFVPVDIQVQVAGA